MLVEFASAVDAARCAAEVQRGVAAQNVDVPQNDIIFDDNDLRPSGAGDRPWRAAQASAGSSVDAEG
jgi:hypothetical protein